jgi:hypothetical protein
MSLSLHSKLLHGGKNDHYIVIRPMMYLTFITLWKFPIGKAKKRKININVFLP